MQIRDEKPEDIPAIREVVEAAFRGAEHTNGREHFLVDALRAANVLSLSLVAEAGGEIVGHVALSPVQIDGRDSGWFGLGPIAVCPNRQGQGIGADLIRVGLDRLRAIGAAGCVLLGDPGYYGRFGFAADVRLVLENVPPEYFLILPFGANVPEGVVEYHRAFWEA